MPAADWLRFLRWPNLVIIAGTMLAVRLAVIPNPVLTDDGFVAIMLATLLIAAAGYVANDVADREIDGLNRPDDVVVGRTVSTRTAKRLALVLNLVAGLLLVVPGRTQAGGSWLLLFPGAAGLLLLYALRLKCTPLAGNVAVAVLSALVPILVVLPELHTMPVASLELVLAFAGFAFWSSLARESAKDLEDMVGDATCGCGTLAVRSARGARALSALSIAILLLGLTFYLWRVGAGSVPVGVASAMVGVPSLTALWKTSSASSARDWSLVSSLLKLAMLGGLVLLVLLA